MSAGNWKEMYAAAEIGDLELVRFHLEQGVDPNYQHPEIMENALFVSVKEGHREVVELLLNYGADPTIKTILEGFDAFQAAKEFQRLDIIDLLDKQKLR